MFWTNPTSVIGQWPKICPSRTWEQNLWTKHHPTLWAPRDFPRSRVYLFTATKPRHQGSKNTTIIFLFFFLVLQQQISISVMLRCLLFMQNLRALNLLMKRCIRYQRNRSYRRRAPYYRTLPRPVESWFKIHYTDRTIPGDYFRRIFTNEQRKLRFVAQRNLQRTLGWRRWAGISRH